MTNYFLLVILQVITKYTVVHCIKYNKNEITKRSSINKECSFINELLQKDTSYDCCSLSGITCSNNHIIEM